MALAINNVRAIAEMSEKVARHGGTVRSNEIALRGTYVVPVTEPLVRRSNHNLLSFMVGAAGLEPATR